jgi:hypothetical protein
MPPKKKAPKPLKKITRLSYLTGPLADDAVRSRIPSQQPAKFSKANVKPATTPEVVAE